MFAIGGKQATLTKAEWYAKAKALDIKGRSKMSKDELKNACSKKVKSPKTASPPSKKKKTQMSTSTIADKRAYVGIVVKYFKESRAWLTKNSKLTSPNLSASSLMDNYYNDLPRQLVLDVGSFAHDVSNMIERGFCEIFKAGNVDVEDNVLNAKIKGKDLSELQTREELMLYVLVSFRRILKKAFVQSDDQWLQAQLKR